MSNFTFQLRRDTSDDWLASTDILREGEPGIELDSGKFKIGDGTSAWADLPYYVTDSQIQTVVDAAVTDLLDGAPEALDTLNEIAAAFGDDPNFIVTMTDELATKLTAVDADALYRRQDSTDPIEAELATFTATSNGLPALRLPKPSGTTNFQEFSITGNTDMQLKNDVGTLLAEFDYSGVHRFPVRFAVGPVNATGAEAMRVSPNSAADAALVAQGAAGQTANLQEWQDSAGAVKAFVDPDGDVSATEFRTNRIVVSPTTIYPTQDNARTLGTTANRWRDIFGVRATLSAVATTDVPITIKGAAGQTENLTEWLNDSGDVLTSIGPDGRVSVGSAAYMYLVDGSNQLGLFASNNIRLNTPSLVMGDVVSIAGMSNDIVWNASNRHLTFTGNQSTRFESLNTTAPQIIVKGTASQTGNMQEWHSSSGFPKMAVSGDGTKLLLDPNISTNVFITRTDNKVVLDGVSGVDLNRNGNAFLQAGGDVTSISALFGRGLTARMLSSIYPAAIFTAVSSPTANITEWRNGSGNVLTSIGPNGQIEIGEGLAEAWPDPLSRRALMVGSTTTGTNGPVVSIVNTRSGGGINSDDLLGTIEFGANDVQIDGDDIAMNAAVGAIAEEGAWGSGSVAAAGLFFSTGRSETAGYFEAMRIDSFRRVGINTTQPTSQLEVASGSSSRVGIIIKGVAAQTHDLQQWQDSAGSIKASIGPDGAVQAITGNNVTHRFGNLLIEKIASENVQLANANLSGTIIGIKEELQLDGPSPVLFTDNASKPLKFEQRRSQGAYGFQFSSNDDVGVSNIVAEIGGPDLDQIGLSVERPTGQTANLQEWKVGGTALTRVTADGDLFFDNVPAASSAIAVKRAGDSLHRLVINDSGDLSWGDGTASRDVALYRSNASTLTTDATFTASRFGSSGQQRNYLGGSSVADTILTLTVADAAWTPLIIRGAAGQTANLQEWRNSSGNNAISAIGPNGELLVTGASHEFAHGDESNNVTVTLKSAGGASEYVSLDAHMSSGVGVTGRLRFTRITGAVTTANLALFDGAVFKDYLVADGGDDEVRVPVNFNVAGRVFLAGAVEYGASVNVKATGSAVRGLVVRGASAQTANLQEWQDSSGAVVTAITPNGDLRHYAASGGATIAISGGTNGDATLSLTEGGVSDRTGARITYDGAANKTVMGGLASDTTFSEALAFARDTSALGFLGAAPVAQQSHIADAPTGGGENAADNADRINQVIAALETYGLLATS